MRKCMTSREYNIFLRKVSDKKIIYCEDYAAQILIEKTLVYMKKEEFFEVVYFHGGEKTLINHYMTPITLNKTLSEKIFMVLDGDMKTDYVFDESTLTKNQLENPQYLADCVKSAFGMDLDVYPDGGMGGKRKDQQCEEYLNYLKYYSTNVFYLPNKMIPEEILLQSRLVQERFGDILGKYEKIDSKNAKEVVREICISEDGDDQNVNHTIKNLANKWSLEESDTRDKLVKDLQIIFDK